MEIKFICTGDEISPCNNAVPLTRRQFDVLCERLKIRSDINNAISVFIPEVSYGIGGTQRSWRHALIDVRALVQNMPETEETKTVLDIINGVIR